MFFNRILWFAVDAVGEVPVPPLVDWQKDCPDLVNELRAIVYNFHNRLSSEMHWSPDALTEWNKYHRTVRKRTLSGLLGPIVKRSVPHVLRLTMIYTLLDNSCLMKPEHLAAAIAVVDYAERSAKTIFGQQTGDRYADKFLWHLDREPDGIPRTDIYAILGRSRSAADVNMTLAVLKENELADCVVTRPKTSKKPIELWFSKRHAHNFTSS